MFRIKQRGPRVFTGNELLKHGYPLQPSHDAIYAVFDVEPDAFYAGWEWRYEHLARRKSGLQSAEPFAVTQAEVLAIEFGSRRWSHVLTPDRRRNRRGVCKSWPQGGPSRGGQAALVKESPALMCRPLLPQERSRHGAASNIETPKVDRPRCGHKSQRFSNGSRWATFLPLKNQRPDPVRHST